MSSWNKRILACLTSDYIAWVQRGGDATEAGAYLKRFAELCFPVDGPDRDWQFYRSDRVNIETYYGFMHTTTPEAIHVLFLEKQFASTAVGAT